MSDTCCANKAATETGTAAADQCWNTATVHTIEPATTTQCETHQALSLPRRQALHRRAKNLALGLVVYNTLEGIISLASGAVADSIALVGFGLDSAIEVMSGLIIIWQFRRKNPEEHEGRALRLISYAFFLLAAYVAFESISTLISGDKPAPSVVGIAVAIASIIVMPSVSYLQRRTGKELGSASVVADSKQVLLCAAMSVALLVGLVGNAALGWWWLDPIVGIFIAVAALREGINARRGESCCTPSALGQ